MTTLVTGATGHIGSNLVRLLLDACDDVRAMIRAVLEWFVNETDLIQQPRRGHVRRRLAARPGALAARSWGRIWLEVLERAKPLLRGQCRGRDVGYDRASPATSGARRLSRAKSEPSGLGHGVGVRL